VQSHFAALYESVKKGGKKRERVHVCEMVTVLARAACARLIARYASGPPGRGPPPCHARDAVALQCRSGRVSVGSRRRRSSTGSTGARGRADRAWSRTHDGGMASIDRVRETSSKAYDASTRPTRARVWWQHRMHRPPRGHLARLGAHHERARPGCAPSLSLSERFRSPLRESRGRSRAHGWLPAGTSPPGRGLLGSLKAGRSRPAVCERAAAAWRARGCLATNAWCDRWPPRGWAAAHALCAAGRGSRRPALVTVHGSARTLPVAMARARMLVRIACDKVGPLATNALSELSARRS
jgi:hypothetical protein